MVYWSHRANSTEWFLGVAIDCEFGSWLLRVYAKESVVELTHPCKLASCLGVAGSLHTGM